MEENLNIIENLNQVIKVKNDLDSLLKEYGVVGGPIFSEYPDKFRALLESLTN